jgi:DNA repair protein RAD50
MKVDASQSLTGDLRTLVSNIEDKKLKIEKLAAEVREAKHESRISECQNKSRTLEERREALNAEILGLSLQADSRARLDIKRKELKTKKSEVENLYALPKCA